MSSWKFGRPSESLGQEQYWRNCFNLFLPLYCFVVLKGWRANNNLENWPHQPVWAPIVIKICSKSRHQLESSFGLDNITGKSTSITFIISFHLRYREWVRSTLKPSWPHLFKNLNIQLRQFFTHNQKGSNKSDVWTLCRFWDKYVKCIPSESQKHHPIQSRVV